MKEGLNLLPSVAKFQAAKIKVKKKIDIVMMTVSGIWVLVMAIIFGWWSMRSFYLNKTKKESDIALRQNKTLTDSVVLSKKNKYQVKIVEKVLSERFEYGSSIMAINEMFSENMIMTDFEIDNRKSFIISGTLVKASDMSEVEGIIRDINTGLVPDFKSAKLNRLQITSTGWLFELKVDLL